MSPPTTIENNKRKRGYDSDDEDEQQSTNNKKLSPTLNISSSSSVQETNLLEENNVSMSDTTNQLPQVLNPVEYKVWSKEEVCSLLCTPEEKGGAALSSEKVKPLYDAGFDGSSLANIVKQLQSKDIDYAYQKISSNRDYQHISQTTLENVVNWADNLLNTRLYHLWDTKHAKEQLCKPITKGGAGLSEEECSELEQEMKVNSVYSEEYTKKQTTGMGEKIKKWIDSIRLLIEPTAWLTEKLKEQESKSIITLVEFITSCFDSNNSNNSNNYHNYEKSSTALVASFGSSFPFVDRQEAVQKIKSIYSNRKLPILDKKDVIIPFIAAAPGIGKSRLLKEIGLELYNNNNNTCIPLFVSFGNGSAIKRGESNNIINSLVIRIIYSFLKSINKSISFRDFLLPKWELCNNFKNVKLIQVLAAISEILNLPNISFYLAIDEAQEIDNGGKDKYTYPLIELLRDIGDNIFGEEKKYQIYPLIAGTYHVRINEALKGSTFATEFIPIGTILPNNQISPIFDHLQIEYSDKMKNWRTNIEFRNYIRTFSGYPRGIETFLEYYVQKENTLETSWKLARNWISKYISNNTNMNYTLLRYILTRTLVTKKDTVKGSDITFSQLENHGSIMLDPTPSTDVFIPTYPAILLYGIIPIDLRDEFERLFFKPQSNLYGLNWEDDIHQYMHLFLNMLSGGESADIKLRELFPTAKMNTDTSKITIPKIPSMIIKAESAHQLQGKLTSTNIRTTTSEIELLQHCYVLKNAGSAKAGDIIITGLQSNDKARKLIFHLQCKWADKYKSSLPYSKVLKEYKKNNEFEIVNENVLNITVIVTCQQITGIPTDIPTDIPTELPNNLIIIDSSNFLSYFGRFADQMQFLHARQLLYINEFNIHQLQSFPGIGIEYAKEIIDTRNTIEGGFIDENDLLSKLESARLINILKQNSNNIIY